MGVKMVTGQKIEPTPIKGKAGSIPVKVQAANDGTNLYVRFSWTQPAGGAPKMDPDNQVKLTMLVDDNKVERAALSGCWESCHGDVRTMPGVQDDKKTKYATPGAMDLMQWASGGKVTDGSGAAVAGAAAGRSGAS